ncbi:MAG: hypothetical protein ACKO7W_22685 [Elainella sp.]
MKEIALKLSWAKAIERTAMWFLNSSDSEVPWVGTGVGAWGADEEDVAKRELNFDLFRLWAGFELG